MWMASAPAAPPLLPSSPSSKIRSAPGRKVRGHFIDLAVIGYGWHFDERDDEDIVPYEAVLVNVGAGVLTGPFVILLP